MLTTFSVAAVQNAILMGTGDDRNDKTKTDKYVPFKSREVGPTASCLLQTGKQ